MNKNLFFFALMMFSCFLLLSGSIIYVSEIPASFGFFALSGVFCLVGILGFIFLTKDKKNE